MAPYHGHHERSAREAPSVHHPQRDHAHLHDDVDPGDRHVERRVHHEGPAGLVEQDVAAHERWVRNQELEQRGACARPAQRHQCRVAKPAYRRPDERDHDQRVDERRRQPAELPDRADDRRPHPRCDADEREPKHAPVRSQARHASDFRPNKKLQERAGPSTRRSGTSRRAARCTTRRSATAAPPRRACPFHGFMKRPIMCSCR